MGSASSERQGPFADAIGQRRPLDQFQHEGAFSTYSTP